MTNYRLLDAAGRRYLELKGTGTVIPNGSITTTVLRRVNMLEHLGIRTFVIESNCRDGDAWNVSEKDRRFHDVDGWEGFTIWPEDAEEWFEAKGYGRK